MADLINGRKPEAIKIGLRNMLEVCGEICGEDTRCLHDICPYDGDSGCNESILMGALALIERLEAQQPKWISVEERLPEEAGKYIVCTRKKAVYCTAFRFFHGRGYFATDTTTHITHWMPLPEPPEDP